MRVTYDKLVRDKIPEIIRASGGTPTTRILDDKAYRAALLVKLTEEAREAADAPEDELLGELADVYEVLLTLIDSCGGGWPQLVKLADAKREARGGFHERIYLQHVEWHSDH